MRISSEAHIMLYHLHQYPWTTRLHLGLNSKEVFESQHIVSKPLVKDTVYQHGLMKNCARGFFLYSTFQLISTILFFLYHIVLRERRGVGTEVIID